MLSSFIQNAQSIAGTLISAFGKASEPSGFLRPLMWSPCMCEITHDVDRLRIDAGRRERLRQQADGRRDSGP